MRFAIAYSGKDEAGTAIINELREIGFLPQMPVIELKKESIYSDDLNLLNYPQLRNIDFVVFATKHQSKDKKPSLSVHAPGNFRQADFGGESGKACTTSCFVIKYLFNQLKRHSSKVNNYHITLEATHHGPQIALPCCFIELGSSEEQWKDKKAARVIAKSILNLQNYKHEKYVPCIGVGGPHYCPNFNKIQADSEYAVGHIIANYNLPLTQNMLLEAEQKTLEQVKTVIIDWKSFKSEERKSALAIIKNLGLNVLRTDKIKEGNFL